MRSRDVSSPQAVIGPRLQINNQGDNQEVHFWLGLSNSYAARRRCYKLSGFTERLENLPDFNNFVVQSYFFVALCAVFMSVLVK